MKQLFKKAIVFGDIHFGLKSNSILHNKDCINFIDWMIELARENECETALFLGDWHHNRASLNLHTLSYSLEALEKLNAGFNKVYFLPGNHDLYYRDSRDIHGIEWAKHLPNIELVNDWFNKDDVAIVPWLVQDDHKKVSKIKAKYIFGHFEFPHFKLNANVTMPDTNELSADNVSNADYVFSGHFHMRQQQKNIVYIGNCFPHNFADADDYERGCMVLEWDKEPAFHNWGDAPSYKVVKLSELLQNDSVLRPNMHLRIIIDMDITYEESTVIKNEYVDKYGLRSLTLVTENNVDDVEAEEFNSQILSVDEIIARQITNITSESYNTKLLIKIYQDL